jgi:hypothetical protein
MLYPHSSEIALQREREIERAILAAGQYIYIDKPKQHTQETQMPNRFLLMLKPAT